MYKSFGQHDETGISKGLFMLHDDLIMMARRGMEMSDVRQPAIACSISEKDEYERRLTRFEKQSGPIGRREGIDCSLRILSLCYWTLENLQLMLSFALSDRLALVNVDAE